MNKKSFLHRNFKIIWRILFTLQWLFILTSLWFFSSWVFIVLLLLSALSYILRTAALGYISKPINFDDFVIGLDGRRKRRIRRKLFGKDLFKKQKTIS